MHRHATKPDLRVPMAVLRPAIEWRARRIADPVERLKFLRRAAGYRLPSWRKVRLRAPGLVLGLLVTLLLVSMHPNSDATIGDIRRPYSPVARAAEAAPAANIWLVEKAKSQEVYSNGLRIETRYAVAGEARSYRAFDLERRPEPGPERTMPAGLVYHTSESHLAPFQAEQNRALKQIGEALIEYVRNKRCYHYVIDRFGRVWRVVEETDVADHAGYSVWADSARVYVNLNHSFLGVSFEAQTRPGEQRPEVTPAQVVAGRLLTAMLRAKYHIPAEDCVTHAQVSVNPDNLRIGYHTDWAGNFPYAELGLSDNYDRPVAALWAFGFNYDPVYLNSTGSRLWRGLNRAEEQLRQEATAHGLAVAQYRRVLHERYRTILAAPITAGAKKERDDHATN